MPGFTSINTISTLHYIVEYRHEDTGYWTEEASFQPDYKITTTVILYRFLWFTWKKIVDEQCNNQEQVEDDARTRALALAKGLHAKDVRVRSCDHFKKYDWWATVWENGKFKDC